MALAIINRGTHMQWMEIGRFLIVVGAVVAFVGMLFLLSDKIPIGKLPGDLHFGKSNVKISIPITTCILISVVVTLIINFFSRK